MERMRFILVFAVCACITTAAFAGPVTPGNVVVVRVGDGSAAVSNAATAVNLVEYTPAGVEVQTIALATTGDNAFTVQGTATTEGFPNVSTDGKYILLTGYAAPVGTATPATNSNLARAIARVAIATGTVDVSTRIDNSILQSGTSIRGAVSDNGSRFWVSTGDKAVVYVPTFGIMQAGEAISTAGNLRCISIFDGQLYVNSGGAATSRAVASVGTGLPTTTGQTYSILNGMSMATGSAYQFQFDTASRLFVGEATNNPGLQEWTESGGTWSNTSTITYSSPGSFGVAVGAEGVTPTIFATVAAKLMKTPKTSPLGSFTDLATAPTNTVFRGLVYIPAAPSSVENWERN